MAICKLYRPLAPGLKIRCENCGVWIGAQCDIKDRSPREEKELDDFIKLMEHDSFERGPSGIRQTRWG